MNVYKIHGYIERNGSIQKYFEFWVLKESCDNQYFKNRVFEYYGGKYNLDSIRISQVDLIASSDKSLSANILLV